MPQIADPVVSLAVSALLVAVFGVALSHKFSDLRLFHATLGEYRLLPGWAAWLLWPLGWLLLVAEGVVCFLLLFSSTRAYAAALAIFLLLSYAGGIALNLARGRREMDCGCTWGGGQSGLSGWLLVRNATLALLAGLLLMPPMQRSPGSLDLLFSSFTALMLVLLYFAAERLIGNWSRLRTLRMH